jgi:hypothetical protein
MARNASSTRANCGRYATDTKMLATSSRDATLWSGRTVAMCHVWTAPELAREIFTSRCWSVQPCVRPLDAVHMTAGHNALRGSGPGQKPAFDNALAHVGCPDRRIDRLCITCCSPSQPSHHAGWPARSRSRRECDRFLVALILGHHGPCHSCDLIGERDRGNLRWPPRQQCGEPGPMFGAMDLGVTDHSKRAGGEQAAQIAIALFAQRRSNFRLRRSNGIRRRTSA